MENIKFEITEEDIKEYLKQHQDDENIKYREAMFVKYIKEHGTVTCEALEMLIKRYNFDDVNISGIYDYDKHGVLKRESLFNFEDHLHRINNLDLSGICHILIPTLKYYGRSEIPVNALYTDLEMIADTLVVPIIYPLDVVENALEDYRICGKIDANDMLIKIKMEREHCCGELLTYQDIYEENKVKRIRKIIRERV